MSDPNKPYGDVQYADPGYQDDGKKRYPLDTEEHCRAAWSYINQQKNAAKYTADELAKIKARIRAAGKKFGIEFADDSANRSKGQVGLTFDDSTSPAVEEVPAEPILYRSSSVVGVNYAQRIIEFIAAPYDEEAVVMWRGEPWREVFLRGAWDGLEKRPNRIKVNREHEKTRTIGKVVNFWPSREEGLVGAARIAMTPLGDETLALADDECLGASVGYVAPPRYVELDKRDRPGLRRVKRAILDHLAFVSDPTWDSAAVLSVRDAAEKPVETPALDELREWLNSRKR